MVVRNQRFLRFPTRPGQCSAGRVKRVYVSLYMASFALGYLTRGIILFLDTLKCIALVTPPILVGERLENDFDNSESEKPKPRACKGFFRGYEELWGSFTAFSVICELAARESTRIVNGIWFTFVLILAYITSFEESVFCLAGGNDTFSASISVVAGTCGG